MKRTICLLLLFSLLPCSSHAEVTKQEAVDICRSFFETMCGVELGDLREARELYVERSRVYVPDVGYPPDAGYCWGVSFKDSKLPIEGSITIHEENEEILDWYCVDKNARASYNNMLPSEKQIQLEAAREMVRKYFGACMGFAESSQDDAVQINANFGMSDSWNNSNHIGEHEPVQSWCVTLYYSPMEMDAYWYAALIIHADTGEIMGRICTEHRRSDPEFYQIIDLSRKKP